MVQRLRVTRQFHFEAAHFLPRVPEGHKCKRVHGHNYVLDVSIEGQLDLNKGWIVDFFDLDQIVAPILQRVDHFLLNDIQGLDNPTVENIVPWFAAAINLALRQPSTMHLYLSKVRVYETPNCWAELEPVR